MEQKAKKRSGFIRRFDTAKPSELSGETIVVNDTAMDKKALYALLKKDVLSGEVFPAVRNGAIDFYYEGGCLYRLSHTSFARDPAYAKYSKDLNGTPYKKAKQQTKRRYAHEDDTPKKRQLLSRLYKHTFGKNQKNNVVVLDIEVCLNGNIGGGIKCDLVLLNTQTNQIMFVEGKVFADKRVNVAVGFTPAVIEQVNTYTKAIAEQPEIIIREYGEYIRIINALFDTKYDPDIHLIPTAKLIVYETPYAESTYQKQNENRRYIRETINTQLGTESVFWVDKGTEPGLDEIWRALC